MSSTESRDKLDRIRRAKHSEEHTSDGPEIFMCPIDGCSRTVIGEPSNLRHHVTQLNADGHQFRTLSEDLGIEIDEEAYHRTWGPLSSEDESEPQESIYESDDVWGPGVPETEVRKS